ncbi:MAG: hypothetical protein Q9168_001727 [Polycauliona sp. 1 TL-2023]
MLLTHRVTRRISYELFLRTHQALSAGLVYAVWIHVKSISAKGPILYLYALTGALLLTSVFEAISIIFRNFAFRQPYSSALIYSKQQVVRIDLSVPRPWKVEAGQYINLWIPAASIRSLLTMQSHPLMIVSWSEGQYLDLQLVVSPQQGLTQVFRSIAENNDSTAVSNRYLAFFSGPHGTSEPMGEYGTVLLFASGLGIVAQLPYIKQLLHDGAECRTRTKRIHLIWQLQEPG